jgi:Domain of unknown function (DUF4917)
MDEIGEPLPWWDGIRTEHDWKTLLVGNGLSINIWPRFDYGSLYARAAGGGIDDGLAADDVELFEALGGSTNFEHVLRDLRTAAAVTRGLGGDVEPYVRRYASIQRALGAAVLASHVDFAGVPEATRRHVADALREFSMVFTTSYDLILYWSMSVDAFEGFCDCFTRDHTFDPWRPQDRVPVFFLHGAMHLVVDEAGVTHKLTRSDRSLLEQFGKPVRGVRTKPLLVTEGSSGDKLEQIEKNDYLAHALTRLREDRAPLVIFGHSLSHEDEHLVEAINRDPPSAVAVSVLPEGDVDAERLAIRARLHRVKTVRFFNARTHPLGSEDLCAAAGAPLAA